MNMNDLENKLFSETCVMHEKKVSEKPAVEKINMINDNDFQKKKRKGFWFKSDQR
jgi:hypothetical protein